MSNSNEFLTGLGVIPISGNQPSGVNIRYDDDFECIEDELAKQGSLIDRGPVNWDKIVKLAINILTNKSKDLKVSCYLIRALYEKESFKGLAVGLTINLQMLETFWDELFPEKQRARSNAYEWLNGKFENTFSEPLAEMASDLDQLEAIEQSAECIQKIEFFLKDKLSEKAPALGNFRRSISELLQLLKARTVAQDEHINRPQKRQDNTLNAKGEEAAVEEIDNREPHQKSEQIKQKKPLQSAAVSVKLAGIGNEKDRNKIFRQCHEALRNVSAWSLTDSLDSPSAYAINRFSTWMAINQLPIHTDNVTPLKPLPKDKINAYNNLFNSGNFQELIPQVEQSFSRAPFWLDAHRMVAQGLQALDMPESAKQVKEHLGLFIRRFPMIIELKFSDKTHFADLQTRQWINTEILTNTVKQTVNSNEISEETDYDDLLTQANELVKKQKMKEAVRLFQRSIATQGNPKKQLFWKYYLAKFCFDNTQTKMAFSLFKKIDRFLQKNNLEYWEADLVKNVVYHLLLCHKQQGTYINSDQQNTGQKNNISADQINSRLNHIHGGDEVYQLYSRLCQLDPALALDFQ